MKLKKTFVFISLVLTIAIIWVFVYFVAGVSSTYPPIEEYEYSSNVDQIAMAIKNYAANNPNVSFKITDTVGNRKDNYAIYMTIVVKIQKDSIIYSLKCEDDNFNKTNIKLVQAYNQTQNIGGYNRDAQGIKLLTEYFDHIFLIELQKQENIHLNSIQ